MDAQIWQIVGAFLTSLGGASIIILGVVSWLGRIWANSIVLRIGSQQQKELEKLQTEHIKELEIFRIEAAERRDAFNSMMTIMSASFAQSHTEILNAVKMTWEKAVEFRENCYKHLTVLAFMTPNEIENLPHNRISESLPSSETYEFTKGMDKIIKEVERQRPLVGEQVWMIFGVYTAFLGRLVTKMMHENIDGQFYYWTKDMDGAPDDFLFDGVRKVLSQGELDIILSGEVFNSHHRIVKALELKLLAEMNELVFGRKLVNMSFDEQLRISEFLRPASRTVDKNYPLHKASSPKHKKK
ncbi:MAG: hypothetical protein C4583_18995 [Anaerolineaceae bacterium]|nr:MAG: hypothetical protein C4583_18995 [Anaerolineaceae bacterium]